VADRLDMQPTWCRRLLFAMSLGFRTIVRAVLALFLVTVATCFMLDLLPGSPGLAVLGTSATPEQVDAFNEAHGFNDPPLDRYLSWLGDIAQGDLQRSTRTNEPVVETLKQRLPVTVQLAVMAEVLAVAVAVPLGLWSAYRAGGRADRVISGTSFALLAVAPFVLALMLVFVFAIDLGWLPVAGWVPLTEDPWENLRHAVLPVLTLAAAEIAVYQRIVRSDAVTTLGEEYVLAARAKGMPTWRILLRHVLRPSSISLVSLAGINLGRLIGGTVIVERVFALPGLGSAAVQGIIGNDFYVVQGIVLVVAGTYVVLNTVVDIGYQYIDPRTRRPAT
jgi:peptide/nickel transport system permease protein